MGQHNFTGEESGKGGGGECITEQCTHKPKGCEQTKMNTTAKIQVSAGASHVTLLSRSETEMLGFPSDQAHAPCSTLQTRTEFMWLGVAAFPLSSSFQKDLPSPLLPVT